MTKPVSGFCPVQGQTQTLNATPANSTITLSSTVVDQQGLTVTYPNIGLSSVTASQIRVYNAGPNAAAIAWGLASKGAVVASMTTNMLIGPGEIETFNKGVNINTIAAICAAGQSASLIITAGEGGS